MNIVDKVGDNVKRYSSVSGEGSSSGVGVYFISDTHFGQWFANWFFSRPFKNLEEMENTIMSNWNAVVNEGDIIIIVGDFYSGSMEYLEYLLDNLNGEKILIKGNHDFGWRYKRLIVDGRIEVYSRLELKGENVNILLTHKAEPLLEPNTINIHGHYHRKLRPFNLDKKHYYNVCVDHTGYKPVHLKEILDHYNNTQEWYEHILDFIRQVRARRGLNYDYLIES